ncbi:MAG TPA: outer membrane protein assembly factor BamD [Acetobacteraceae bacterium]|nr:outer membrane protein assembly factor BamD [Acetobacteraceae bacterium]
MTLTVSLRRSGLCLAVLTLLAGCQTVDSVMPWGGSGSGSKSDPDQSVEDRIKKQDANTVTAQQLYNNGIDALNEKNYSLAVKQFDQVQQNFPYSPWAVNAELMEGYAEYKRQQYTEAVSQLDRFIQLHPTHKDIAYAYYLRALCYYEQIADIQRDQKTTQDAMNALQEVVNRFPGSAYARDARLKIDLCRDHLAGKEMEVGRFYEKQHLYGAAIGRFQRVVDDFQTTNHAPEALHRLTEVYLRLGLKDQAKKTASVLAYNYPGSPWYADSWNDLVDAGAVTGEEKPVRNTGQGFFSRAFGWIF